MTRLSLEVFAVASIAILSICAPANADEILLSSGGTIAGKIVKVSKDEIVIENKFGTVGIHNPDKEVVSITYGRTTIHEYYDKYDKIKDSKDKKDFLGLADWAHENALDRFSKKLYETVLQKDPDDWIARGKLGFKLCNGKWMTEKEIMLQMGLEQYAGKWITPAEKEDMQIQEMYSKRWAAICKEADSLKIYVQPSARQESPAARQTITVGVSNYSYRALTGAQYYYACYGWSYPYFTNRWPYSYGFSFYRQGNGGYFAYDWLRNR